MWHHSNSLWLHKMVFMTSHPHYSWHHPHCIWHYIHSTCDITATVTMTRHLLCFWHILSVYDISHGEWITTQWLYLTWYPMYLCNQTHLIDDITPYVCMKSYPLHAWHHRHFIWHHNHSCWQHTILCMSGYTLSLWHHMYYIWRHPYCVYDYPTLYLTWNLLKLPSLPLCMSSHPLCRRHPTSCIRHHRWHMYGIICTIHDIISTLYDNNP